MYDTIKPLDFNEQTIVEEATYITAVYNVEERGLTWDDIHRIFPDNGPLMEARYLAESTKGE